MIIDLEDAVAPGAKASAREGLAGGLEGLDGVQIWLRVNAVGTEWHSADMAAAASVSVHAVMLPKAENAAQLAGVRAQLRPGQAPVLSRSYPGERRLLLVGDRKRGGRAPTPRLAAQT